MIVGDSFNRGGLSSRYFFCGSLRPNFSFLLCLMPKFHKLPSYTPKRLHVYLIPEQNPLKQNQGLFSV